MWRSPFSPQIHQKYVYMQKDSYRTPTEHGQKTSDFPKGKKLPGYLGRVKEKRKKQDKRIGTGPAHQGGSCERGKVSTHQEVPSLEETGWVEGGSFRAMEESTATGVQREKWRDSCTEDLCQPALASLRSLSAHPPEWVGAGNQCSGFRGQIPRKGLRLAV